MLKNYFKIAWRNLWNNKVYSSVNIIGLTVGLSACLLVATVAVDELSYDRQWTNANDLYRIIETENMGNAVLRSPNSASGLGPVLKSNFPEVKEYCRMEVEEKKLKFEEGKNAVPVQSLLAEATVWNVLDLSITRGNPKKIIEGYDNIILTEKIKKQYFPDSDPVGKKIYDLTLNGNSREGIITGVIRDLPKNTHLRADIIVMVSYLRGSFTGLGGMNVDFNKFDGHSVSSMQQYLLLTPGTDKKHFVQKIDKWAKELRKESAAKFEAKFAKLKMKLGDGPDRWGLDLQPFTDVYLGTDVTESKELRGNRQNIYVFGGITALLLFIACISYINMATARALKRIRETGIHKILGAKRKQLIMQFLFESLLFFLIAFVFSILVYGFSLRLAEGYLGREITFTVFNNKDLFVSTLPVLFIVCIFTGLYPGLILTRFRPVDTIRGKLTGQVGGTFLRKALITVQFVISVAVLLACITVYSQLRFLNTSDIGYDKSNLLEVGQTRWGKNAYAFKQELLKISGVERASITTWYPGAWVAAIARDDPGNSGNKIRIGNISGDFDFAATLGLQLQSGRLFDPSRPKDDWDEGFFPQAALISDAYAKAFDVKKLNRELRYPIGGGFGYESILPIGIVKNFHNKSLLEKEEPFRIWARREMEQGAMLIRVKPGVSKQVIASLEKLYNKYYPEQILSYNWVEDMLASQYRFENRLNAMFIFFTLLTVFLACLGLFGLVVFTVEQRVKEVGIRKVLGASVISIVNLISRDFLKLVLLAIIIASPLAWYFMNQWLQEYPYRIEIQWWMFAGAGILAVSIALLTISFKAVKAAMTNPVNSLRSE